VAVSGPSTLLAIPLNIIGTALIATSIFRVNMPRTALLVDVGSEELRAMVA
jgi:hypothetical protein